MVKAKAKADRAAARLAAHQAHVAQVSSIVVGGEPSSTVMAPTVDRETSPATGPDVPSLEVDEAGDNIAVEAPESEVVPDRTEMLRSKSAVVAKFMQLLVPILIDVYAASVITPVRIKTLTGLLKAVSFLDGDGLKRVLMVSLDNQPTVYFFLTSFYSLYRSLALRLPFCLPKTIPPSLLELCNLLICCWQRCLCFTSPLFAVKVFSMKLNRWQKGPFLPRNPRKKKIQK